VTSVAGVAPPPLDAQLGSPYCPLCEHAGSGPSHRPRIRNCAPAYYHAPAPHRKSPRSTPAHRVDEILWTRLGVVVAAVADPLRHGQCLPGAPRAAPAEPTKPRAGVALAPTSSRQMIALPSMLLAHPTAKSQFLQGSKIVQLYRIGKEAYYSQNRPTSGAFSGLFLATREGAGRGDGGCSSEAPAA